MDNGSRSQTSPGSGAAGPAKATIGSEAAKPPIASQSQNSSRPADSKRAARNARAANVADEGSSTTTECVLCGDYLTEHNRDQPHRCRVRNYYGPGRNDYTTCECPGYEPGPEPEPDGPVNASVWRTEGG